MQPLLLLPLLMCAEPDSYKHAGLNPQEAAAAMTVPEGFDVKLFAGEPDVHQPIAMCIDDRGRVWIAEGYTYPQRHKHPGPVLPKDERAKGDRIVIFEDTDGDGQHDKRTLFMDGLNLVSGMELGFGGVYIGAAPYLLFIPDKDKDDKPDSEPTILLDGWGYEDTHETLNSFHWGPDGWLYGCHGIFTHSNVGKPGTRDKDRTKLNAGVWRYHPVRHQFEVFAHGTSNPWGLDHNANGDFFVEACVIPHLFHMVQGGRYQRQAGQHFNPYTYADIPTILDHLHWQGDNQWAGNKYSGSLGGGHAHCGILCYQGGAWPEEYNGKLFIGNIHGKRFNMDIPVPQGSSYVAKHGKDFLLANDEYARFIDAKVGPDGNVYIIDWYDKQACHLRQPEVWDRTNGRIYKISYKGTNPVVGVDLSKCSDAELAEYQFHDNEWYVIHARRILHERAPSVSGDSKIRHRIALSIGSGLSTEEDHLRLNSVLTLHVMDDLDVGFIREVLKDPSPHIRGWVIQLWMNDHDTMGELSDEFLKLCQNEKSPVTQRFMLSALNQMPVAERKAYIDAIISNIPSSDTTLSLLLWYAVEPMLGEDPTLISSLGAKTDNPMLRQFMARRVAAIGSDKALSQLIAAITSTKDAAAKRDFLDGFVTALQGRPPMKSPKGWDAAFAKLDKNDAIWTLGLKFGNDSASEHFRSILKDKQKKPEQRIHALNLLQENQDAGLSPILNDLLDEPTMRSASIKALARFPSEVAARKITQLYPTLTIQEKRDALATLAARKPYAKQLLTAIESKKIPVGDVPAETIRQLRNLKDKAITTQIASIWGVVRNTSAERKQQIAEWKRRVSDNAVSVDLEHGRAMFTKTCVQCHTLYGVGGKVGPDITGSNRGDIDYLLENIFNSSAVIPKEYAMTQLELLDGRSIIGIVKQESDTTLTVATANETLTIPVADVDVRTPSPLSMMPDDVVQPLSEQAVRDLIAYLRSPTQTSILATTDNAVSLFNGKDLTGWVGDPKLWKVVDGEIVGTSTGLKKNQFLKSEMVVENFKLTFKVKLTPNSGNSGVQFRSKSLDDGEMAGPQADIGEGWWGKLYEENMRGLLGKVGGEKYVKVGEWNDYSIEAIDGQVVIRIDGKVATDLIDGELPKRGIIALQLHSGDAMEVRFRDLKLEVK